MRSARKTKFWPAPDVRGLTVMMPLLAVLMSVVSGADQVSHASPVKTAMPALKATARPVYFEANGGQLPAGVDWRLRGAPYHVDLAAGRAMFIAPVGTKVVEDSTQGLVMRLVDANPTAVSGGTGGRPGHVQYLKGKPSDWIRNISAYPAVRYSGVYPGIDLVYYGKQRRLEYDFVVSPGADPSRIRLDFAAAESISVQKNGDLLIDYGAGQRLVQKAPVVYQQTDGVQQHVDGRYRIEPGKRVSFRLAAYDHKLPLTIDPVLVYASFYGGNGDDRAYDMARDINNNIYLTGVVTPDWYSATTKPTEDDEDVFVTKLDQNYNLIYTVYIGGSKSDVANAIAVDDNENVYLTGRTQSVDMPPGSICTDTEPAPGGDLYCDDKNQAFLIKLDNTASPSITFSDYFGGSQDDVGLAIDVESTGGVAYIAGTTRSYDFPVINEYQTTLGSGTDPTTAGVNADDIFVKRVDTVGATTTHATYFGGMADDVPAALVIDGSDNVYLTGYTLSADFPTTAGAYDLTCAYDGNCGRDIAGRRVAIAGTGGMIRTAIPDDTTWTVQASGTTNTINDMVWGNGQYTTVGGSGTILSSVDGGTWNAQASGTTSDLNGLVWGGGQFVAVGVSGTILASVDGATWNDNSTGSSNLASVAWNGSQYVTVGASGAVLTSTDGITWTAQTSGTSADLNAVAWGGTQFIAVGDVGTVLSSIDGVTWTAESSGTTNNLYAIAWGEGQFVAVGASGAILTSIDGSVWVTQSSGVAVDLLDVDWGTNGFGVAGNIGTILISQGGVDWYTWASGTGTNLHTLVWSRSLVGADAFVAKLDFSGAPVGLTYSTYLGGDGYDFGTAIRVDGSGQAYIAGYTLSDDLATTGVYQQERAGSDDAFVARLDATGANLDFLTYLGGRSRDIAEDMAIDGSGKMYLTGYTYSTDFPAITDISSRSERCIEKPIDPVYACNADMFIARLAAGSTALDYSLYMGDVKTDIAKAIAIDTSGADTQLYVAGYTNSTLFPVTTSTVHGDAADNGDQSDAVLVQLSEASGDLAVTVNDAADPVIFGNNVSYTVTVTNNGADDVPGVVMTDNLPGSVKYVSATPAQGSCTETNGVVSCQLGTVAASASVAVTVVGFPKRDDNYDNQVSVSGLVTDTNSTNNTASESTLVSLASASTSTSSGSGSLDAISETVLALFALMAFRRYRRLSR